MKEDTLFGEENFFEKRSHNVKNMKGGSFGLASGIVCYAEKEKKPFWTSSFGQQVQFGPLK